MPRTLAAILALALAGAMAGTTAAADFKPWTGGALPAFVLKDLDGVEHRLADFRGKVVLVNFWATWCGPCRDEMPSIQELRSQLKGKPFAVLAINLDEPESRVRKFLAQWKVDLPVLLDPDRKVAREWNARILPATYIIGPDGRIRYSVVGELNWCNDVVVGRISELLPSAKARP
jgi:thiol-disulfide isomerase/thioredoxin